MIIPFNSNGFLIKIMWHLEKTNIKNIEYCILFVFYILQQHYKTMVCIFYSCSWAEGQYETINCFNIICSFIFFHVHTNIKTLPCLLLISVFFFKAVIWFWLVDLFQSFSLRQSFQVPQHFSNPINNKKGSIIAGCTITFFVLSPCHCHDMDTERRLHKKTLQKKRPTEWDMNSCLSSFKYRVLSITTCFQQRSWKNMQARPIFLECCRVMLSEDDD